jgi:predicted DNA binding CopG/RHH family protein
MKLDDYEKDILESFENNEWKSISDLKTRKEDLKTYVSSSKKAISIRLAENDLHEIKKISLKNGLPYQNIIQLLIRQFISGQIELKLQH